MLAKFNSSRPDKRHKLKPVDSSLYKVEIASKEQAKERHIAAVDNIKVVAKPMKASTIAVKVPQFGG